jgi:hypothetical protein
MINVLRHCSVLIMQRKSKTLTKADLYAALKKELYKEGVTLQ